MRKVSAIIGAILLVISLALVIYIGQFIDQGTAKATNRDKLQHIPPLNGNTNNGVCDNFALALQVDRRVITESDTSTLVVNLSQANAAEPCPVQISLEAPTFTPSPGDLTRAVVIPRNSRSQLSWVLSPQKPGTFDITVDASPFENYDQVATIGLTVTNVFGLNPWQVQAFSLLGTFLGPLLTAAWWYDRWKEHRQKKEAAATNAKISVNKTGVRAGSKKRRH